MHPEHFLVIPPNNSASFVTLQKKRNILLVQRVLQANIRYLSSTEQMEITKIRNYLYFLLQTQPQRLISLMEHIDIAGRIQLLQHSASSDLWRYIISQLLQFLGYSSTILQWSFPIDSIIQPPHIIHAPTCTHIQLHPHGIEYWNDNTILALDTPVPFLHTIRENLYLSTVDTNPLSMHEAHPEKQGNTIDLGEKNIELWIHILDRCCRIIEDFLPTLWKDFTCFMRYIIPVGYHEQRHESASYAEFPGIAYLTLHPDILTMTEAIIHESQHSKINIVLFHDPILENGHSEWTTSPIRPDMRPLHGVLLAVHAFIPVSILHKKLAEAKHPISFSETFHKRQKEVWQSNQEGLSTLQEKAIPTKLGASLLKALQDAHTYACS